MLKKLRKKIHDAPDKKRYIDFIAALFGIPVLITVLIINLGNLQDKKDVEPNNPQTIVIETTPGQSTTFLQIPPGCTKKVGPIEIKSPEEGQEVTSNPVNIVVSYDSQEYCSVVWSYRINNGTWSEYSSSSISIYNPPPGEITLDLRVQSTASNDTTELQRRFDYTGSNNTNTATTEAALDN